MVGSLKRDIEIHKNKEQKGRDHQYSRQHSEVELPELNMEITGCGKKSVSIKTL
jgi:hypothetical protein